MKPKTKVQKKSSNDPFNPDGFDIFRGLDLNSILFDKEEKTLANEKKNDLEGFTSEIPEVKPSGVSVAQNINFFLTPFQFAVYSTIKQLKGRETTQKKISQLSNVNYRTTRDTIKYMKDNGLFSVYEVVKNATFQGLKISINPKIKAILNHKKKSVRSHNMPTEEPLGLQNAGRRVIPDAPTFIGATAEHSSGIAISENITDSDNCNENVDMNKHIEKILNENAELGYWRLKELKWEQIKNWMDIAGCSLGTMVQYLCYCRFEMVDKKLEETKPIKNVFNWFYKIIEKIGHYPKPEGYKSFQQKQLELEQKVVEQKENEAKQAKDLYKRKVEAEQEKKFWDMMNNPEGELYKKCFEKLNAYEKQNPETKSFEMGMRNVFDNRAV